MAPDCAAMHTGSLESGRRDFAVDAIASSRAIAPRQTRRFYLWMAVVFVLVSFGGFTPSYWSRLAAGGFHPPPIMHIHGALLFSWTLFYLAQTAWVASGRTATHRAWGLVGISLFTLVICSIVLLKITVIRLDDARGLGEASRRFSAIALCALPMLIATFALAIAKVQRPEIHKRLMYLLMAGMSVPAIARVFLAVLAPPGALEGGPPPPFVALPPTLVAVMLVGVAIAHDWRAGRRPHPVYVYGSFALLTVSGLSVLIASTAGWLRFAGFVAGLGG